MKMTPDYIEAHNKMQPGVITSEGFLGNDTRKLVEIIAADESEMIRLGITFEEVYEKLLYLQTEGEKALGEPSTVDGKWIVQAGDVRGKLPSPFGDGIFHKNSVVVQNVVTKKALIYSRLSLHLLEKYHFLQGKGSPFRLDPVDMKEILEL
ncbi:MAG: hypothetical protein JW982_00745 [Spirochaetes bacterium]|nr:hypothetical protein [Spirochaetota bacterium]